jgi:hypothetical protein
MRTSSTRIATFATGSAMTGMLASLGAPITRTNSLLAGRVVERSQMILGMKDLAGCRGSRLGGYPEAEKAVVAVLEKVEPYPR